MTIQHFDFASYPHAFVDESGDANMQSLGRGATDYFVVSSVVVFPKDYPQFHQTCERARSAFFPGGEIKSVRLPGKDDRRQRLLSDICEAPFLVHLLAVDKHAIHRDSGLSFKRSFLKYMNGKLYDRLFRALPDLRVVADEHGSREFMDGFRTYVRKHYIPTLFSIGDISFVPSHEHVGVQVADLIAGSFRIALTEQDGVALRELCDGLDEKLVTLQVWPPDPSLPARERSDDGHELDAAVREHSFRVAARWLRRNEKSDDEDIRYQTLVLEHLLRHAQWVSDAEFVPTKVLKDHLAKHIGQRLDTQDFRSRVIGRLRDGGLLIASGPGGYKIPVCVGDMDTFVERADQIIRPLIRRLQTAHGDLLTATGGRLDVLGRPGLEYLRRAIITDPVAGRDSKGRDAAAVSDLGTPGD